MTGASHHVLERARRRVATLWLACCAALWPAGPALASGADERLPPSVLQALERSGLPSDALAAVVLDLDGGRALLQWQARRPVNPASLAKLVTTAAALERLGPAYQWQTPVWIQGSLRDGVLDGSLHIRGGGDPRLVVERLWLLLRRVQQQGVREIRGDIVLDQTAFAPALGTPADFDGEPLRPHNVQAAALLLNFRSAVYRFVPDAAAGVARVLAEPATADGALQATVPLAAGPCDDWRTQLRASFEPGRVRFAGSYPSACGELAWPVADPQPATHDARLLESMWRELGGRLTGRVREGPAPASAPSFVWASPPLAEVVRDINKHSNNVMAQQLFLTLALQAAPQQPATPEAGREQVARWLLERTGEPLDEFSIDNGSGLSRHTRISARRLARLLQVMWASPQMPEFIASLPLAGVDGTARRSLGAMGRAHLKTGSLRDVAGLAGYVLSAGGRRLALVAVVQHPQAGAARPALDALLQWAQRDAPRIPEQPLRGR